MYIYIYIYKYIYIYIYIYLYICIGLYIYSVNPTTQIAESETLLFSPGAEMQRKDDSMAESEQTTACAEKTIGLKVPCSSE